jgi:hypothetical protein
MATETVPISAAERLAGMERLVQELRGNITSLDSMVVSLRNIISGLIESQDLLIQATRSDMPPMKAQYAKRYKERLENINNDLTNLR